MLSLIIPVRDWPGDRLKACVSSFCDLGPTVFDDIVVLDFGSECPVRLDIDEPHVQVVRVAAGAWSLAEAINAGVIHTRNSVIVKTDADIVVGRNSGLGLLHAARAVLDPTTNVGMAIARCQDLPRGLQPNDSSVADTDGLAKLARLRPRWGQGGLVVFARETWESIGGFDHRFRGWGGEDNDFANRVRGSGKRLVWIDPDDVDIYHFWHARFGGLAAAQQTRRNRKVQSSDKSSFRSLRFSASALSPIATPQICNPRRPLVTVALATRARPGRDRMIAEAVASFSRQIDGDYEIVVADNGSTEAEQETLRQTLLPFSQVVRLEILGEASIPKARNFITDIAAAPYICIADDDDLSLPNRLADHLACFRSGPNVHGSHGGWIEFDEETGRLEQHTGKERTLAGLLFGGGKISTHSASFYRTDVMRRIRYDESRELGSDWDMALRMANLGLNVTHTRSFVTARRWHDANVTINDPELSKRSGSAARANLYATLGQRYVGWLKSIAKNARISLVPLSEDQVLRALPYYAGHWRLYLNVSEVDEPDPDVAAARAAIVDALPGDVGVLRCSVGPDVVYISDAIDGAGLALRTKLELESKFGVELGVIGDGELQASLALGFDWTSVAMNHKAVRLISDPFSDIVDALKALASLPEGTLGRALLNIVSDFDEAAPRFFLLTKPVTVPEGVETANVMLSSVPGTSFSVFHGMPA